MIRAFAVQPEALNTAQRFRYVMEKFGFHQGRIVSRYPGKWERQVLKALNPATSGTLDETRVTELLRQYRQDRIANTSHGWDTTIGWIDNALAHNDSDEPFHAILADRTDADRKIIGIDDADETTFEVPRGVSCRRSAEALVATILPLIRYASLIRLVDRIVLGKSTSAQGRWFELIAAIQSALIASGNMHAAIEFHSVTSEGDPTIETNNLQTTASSVLAGSGVKFHIWVSGERDASHARYVLTDVGGLSVDAGLDVTAADKETDVSILDKHLWVRRLADYDPATSPYRLFREFAV